MLFLENEVQTDQKNYGTMLFMPKQVSLPKISSILQKVKIGPKTDLRPFCMKAFNFSKSSTANHLMTKLARSTWLVIGLILFLHLQTSTQSLHKHAQKLKLKLNLANIQPSGPHAWSVTRVSTIN